MMTSWLLGRRGPSGFSWSSTADEVTEGISAAGLTAIVTGPYHRPEPLSLSLAPIPSDISPHLLIQSNPIRHEPGASSGIGVETARTLALRGAHVVMAARSVPAAQAVRDAVLAEAPGARLDVMELDLASMASVRAFASEFISRGLPLNILMYVCYFVGAGAAYSICIYCCQPPSSRICMRTTWEWDECLLLTSQYFNRGKSVVS